MFEGYKNLIRGKWKAVDTKMTWPLTRWVSGVPEQLLETNELNKYYFALNDDSLRLQWLSLIAKRIGKFPKALKDEKARERWDRITDSCGVLYGWSSRECRINKDIIVSKFDDPQFLEQTAQTLAWDNKARKSFGLKPLKAIKVTMAPKKVMGLGAF